MERRDFIRTTAAGLAAAAGAGAATGAGNVEPRVLPENPAMKYRTLGRSGQRVSMVGVGGFHLGHPKDSAEATRIVHGAIDHGVTFFDNCWDYNGGESEARLGRALEGGRRDRVFLMTKIDGRTSAAAQSQLDESLRRLRTDHLDLLQFHEIIREDDPERIFGQGAFEVAMRAREQGKIRYLGFTGHKSPLIHKKMLELSFQRGWTPDTVQMPLNVMDAHFHSFEQIVLPILVQHGIGVLGMKPMGDHFILDSKVASAPECLRYTMSLPTSVTITGIDSLQILQQALDVVRDFTPYTAQERQDLLARTATASRDGQYERYKVSHHFDGTVQNPQWLG